MALCKGPSVEVGRYVSEYILASRCVFVCARCAKETSLTSPCGACPRDGGKRRGSGMEKERECKDEIKRKINSRLKERLGGALFEEGGELLSWKLSATLPA